MYFDDFWRFDFENAQWQSEKKKSSDLLGVVAEKVGIKGIKGTAPGKRFGHSMVADGCYNILVLAGGSSGSQEGEEKFGIWIFDLNRSQWICAEHFGVQPAAFASAQLVKIPFEYEEFNTSGLLVYMVMNPATKSFQLLTLIIDLQMQIVQALWTDIEGLEEYFKENATEAELRLDFSLENLGQLIDLQTWRRAQFVFTSDYLQKE